MDKTTKNKGGRPKAEVDEKQVYELAKIHCTNNEIAAICGVSKDTIERRFAAILDKGREDGRCKLRRLQWQSAENGNVVMQLWLGKQLLGQREPKNEEKDESIDEITISVEAKAIPK